MPKDFPIFQISNLSNFVKTLPELVNDEKILIHTVSEELADSGLQFDDVAQINNLLSTPISKLENVSREDTFKKSMNCLYDLGADSNPLSNQSNNRSSSNDHGFNLDETIINSQQGKRSSNKSKSSSLNNNDGY